MFGARREGPSAIEKDYLVRQLKQLLGALLKKVLQEGQPPEQSQEDLRNICGELLDVDYDGLSRLNAPSIAMLLRSPERIEAFALIMEAEAQQVRAKGNDPSADALESRAQRVRLAQSKTADD